MLLYNTRDYEGLDEGICCLAPGYRAGVQLLVEKLIAQGHKRIGFVPNMCERINHRYDGFVCALEKHGMTPDPAYICSSNMSDNIGVTLQEVAEMFAAGNAPSPTALYSDESVMVGINTEELAQKAVDMMMDMLAGNRPANCLMEMPLIEGESVDAPANE